MEDGQLKPATYRLAENGSSVVQVTEVANAGPDGLTNE